MRELINKRVREFTGQCLGNGNRCQVSVGQNQRGFGAKEFGEFRFQPDVNLAIAGGATRRGHVQAVGFQRQTRGLRNPRVPGEAKIIATGKIEQSALTQAHFVDTDKLQRLRLGHGRMINSAG